MKTLLLCTALIVIFTGCKKLNDTLPESNTSEQISDTGKSATDNIKLLKSLKVTPVIADAQQQIVKASVTGKMLTLAYNEKVHLLIDKQRYDSSWYIVFNEDFKNTELDGLDFKTVMQWGDTVINWKPYNLNQIDKTITDTVIGGEKVVNVKFARSFNFFKEYKTTQEATAKMDAIIGKKEKLKFVTRYEPDTDTTKVYTINVNLAYVK